MTVRIAIFPGVKKAGFVVGGQWGRGIISVRDNSPELLAVHCPARSRALYCTDTGYVTG